MKNNKISISREDLQLLESCAETHASELHEIFRAGEDKAKVDWREIVQLIKRVRKLLKVK